MLSDEDVAEYRSLLEQSVNTKRPVTIDFIHGKWSVSSWGTNGGTMVETYGKKKEPLKSVIIRHKADLVVCRIGGTDG